MWSKWTKGERCQWSERIKKYIELNLHLLLKYHFWNWMHINSQWWIFFYIWVLLLKKRVLCLGYEKGQEEEIERIVVMIQITSINIYNTLLVIVLGNYNADYLCRCWFLLFIAYIIYYIYYLYLFMFYSISLFSLNNTLFANMKFMLIIMCLCVLIYVVFLLIIFVSYIILI